MALLGDSFFFELEGEMGVNYPVGSEQSFMQTFGTISSNTLSANRIVGKIVRIKSTVTVDRLTIRVTGAAVGNAVIGIYKYNDNGTDTGEWTLEAQTPTEYDTNVAATQSIVITPTTLMPGVYCFGVVCSANFSMYMDTFISADSFFGFFATLGSTAVYKNSMFESFTYNSTMPATLTSPIITANSLTPLVIARVI